MPSTTLMPDDSGEVTIFIAGFDKQLDKQESILNKEAVFGKNFLYPNPAKDILTLELAKTAAATIAIYYAKGMLVDTKKGGTQFNYFDVSRWSSGVYLLKIIQEENTETMRFVKE